MIEIYLKKGREKSAIQRHPWLFSGAIERTEGELINGGEARLMKQNGEFLARGFYAIGQISCRLCRWEDAPIDRQFIRDKILQASAWRKAFFNSEMTDAYRLFNAEGDGLPGLIIDRYGDIFVLQLNNAGVDSFRDAIVEILDAEFSPLAIYEKSLGGGRAQDGLPQRSGVLRGDFNSGAVRIKEHGLVFYVDIASGQKTGFYLDQRENRQMVRRLAQNKTVLNSFAYSGAFAVAALAGGAKSVTNVESSGNALKLARKNIRENGFEPAEEEFVVADVFTFLRSIEKQYQFIILDPPAFAKSRQSVQKAARAYKDLNLFAIKALEPGGLLFTASCSQHLSPDLFQKILFAAAADSGRQVDIIGESGHPVDHPISIYHPEGRYLHAFLLAACE